MVVCDVIVMVVQAVGASIRIFELMDRQSEVKDGHDVPGHFHRGTI